MVQLIDLIRVGRQHTVCRDGEDWREMMLACLYSYVRAVCICSREMVLA